MKRLRPLETLRWLLVVPVGIAVCWLGMAVAVAMYLGVERLCPGGHRVSGMCVGEWAAAAGDAALALGAALGAAAVVGVSAWMAPRGRIVVALLAYAAGFAFASWLTAFGTTNAVPFVAAASAGLAMVVGICVRSLTP